MVSRVDKAKVGQPTDVRDELGQGRTAKGLQVGINK